VAIEVCRVVIELEQQRHVDDTVAYDLVAVLSKLMIILALLEHNVNA